MVYVRLAQGWTDSAGTDYPAGAMVDVDAATLAGLEASGVVAEAKLSPNPNGGNPEPSGGNPEPSGGNPEPSGGGGDSLP